MKKPARSLYPIFAGIFAVLLSILACAPFGSDNTPPTSTHPPPPPPVAQPTNTSRPLPTREISTPTEEVAAFFTEEFSVTPLNWSYYVLFGDENYFSEYIQDDMLVMELNDVGLYVFNLYDPYIYENVIIELYATNMGRNSNNINILCRYSDYGWYEFTMQNDGLYQIWAYDSAGDTGYNMLASGASFAIQTQKGSNQIDVECATASDGNLLSIYVNNQALKTITDKQYYLPQGQIGFGVNVSPTNQVVPVIVGFDYVTIAQP
jgi:hypothetical protein